MEAAARPPPRIFLSYRRSGDIGFVGRVADRLAAAFGEGQVFRDLTALRAGESFEQRIGQWIDGADVVIVLIGERWAGRRLLRRSRLHDYEDWVRKEVQHALARDKPVVPVLLGDAPLPRQKDIPPSMHGLLSVHTSRIRDETFAHDAQRLIDAIAALTAAKPEGEHHAPFVWRRTDSADPGPDRRLWIGVAGLAVLATATALLVNRRGDGAPAVNLDDPRTWKTPPLAKARGPISHLALQLALFEMQSSTKERTGDNDGYNVGKFTQRFRSTLNLPWSAAFIGWCYLEATKRHWNAAGASLRFTDSPSASVVADSLRRQGWLVEPFDAADARPGDIIFFKHDQRVAHMEIIYAIADGKVCSIGGNVDNKVSGRCRQINGDWVAALGALPPDAFTQAE